MHVTSQRSCRNLNTPEMVLTVGAAPTYPALQAGAFTGIAKSANWSRARESNPALLLTKQLDLHGLHGKNGPPSTLRTPDCR
jgi:hypothetical protein